MLQVPTGYKVPNDRMKIWRYMDFAKFVSLLDKSALFFALVSTLEGDPMEGRYSSRISKVIPPTGKVADDFVNAMRNRRPVGKFDPLRDQIAVNCWHMNMGESHAMWCVYSKKGQGVAIQSTYKRLKQVLESCPIDVQVAKVIYSFDNIKGPSTIIFEDTLYKWKSYRSDNELRAFVFRPAETTDGVLNSSTFQEDKGIYVDVCLNDLIGKVYVSPSMPKWLKGLVQSMMDKYKLNKQVVPSSLEGPG